MCPPTLKLKMLPGWSHFSSKNAVETAVVMLAEDEKGAGCVGRDRCKFWSVGGTSTRFQVFLWGEMQAKIDPMDLCSSTRGVAVPSVCEKKKSTQGAGGGGERRSGECRQGGREGGVIRSDGHLWRSRLDDRWQKSGI